MLEIIEVYLDVSIYVSSRNDLTKRYYIDNGVYIPIICNATKECAVDGVIGDNTGDNISFKADHYSEMSVQYWMWKNVQVDYYGLCHYRRYLDVFSRNRYLLNEYGLYEAPYLCDYSVEKLGLASREELKKEIAKYDAIVNKACDVKGFKTASGRHNKNVLELWDDVALFDIKYLYSMLEVIKKQNACIYNYAVDYLGQKYHRGYNCYILNKQLFEELNSFEWPILNEMEIQISEESLEKSGRTLGYLSEILYGIYIYYIMNKKNPMKIKEVPLVLFDETSEKTLIGSKEVLKAEIELKIWIIIKRISDILFPHASKRRVIVKRIYGMLNRRSNKKYARQ